MEAEITFLKKNPEENKTIVKERIVIPRMGEHVFFDNNYQGYVIWVSHQLKNELLGELYSKDKVFIHVSMP